MHRFCHIVCLEMLSCSLRGRVRKPCCSNSRSSQGVLPSMSECSFETCFDKEICRCFAEIFKSISGTASPLILSRLSSTLIRDESGSKLMIDWFLYGLMLEINGFTNRVTVKHAPVPNRNTIQKSSIDPRSDKDFRKPIRNHRASIEYTVWSTKRKPI